MFLPSGSDSRYGASERNPIVRLVPRQSLQLFPWIARLPQTTSMDQGACLGIPGITAHRGVHVAGDVSGRTVLVQGAAGSVGLCAVQLARRAGAHVIGTIRSSSEEATAKAAGAHEVVSNDEKLATAVKALAPSGIDHIVEVALGANIEADVELLNMGGSVAT
jgi:NADPH:quinone reductase